MCRLVSWFCDVHEAPYNLTLETCKKCQKGAPCEKTLVKTGEGWDENVVPDVFKLKLTVKHRDCPACVNEIREGVREEAREHDPERERVRQREPRTRETAKKKRVNHERAFVRRKKDRPMGLLESLFAMMSGKW